MELACTPRCVGYISPIGQWPERNRQTVDVVHGETQSRSIACDPDEVMPLQRENGAVATDNNELRRIRVIAELLHEPETSVETRRSRHVADVQYRLDALDLRRHARILAHTADDGYTDLLNAERNRSSRRAGPAATIPDTAATDRLAAVGPTRSNPRSARHVSQAYPKYPIYIGTRDSEHWDVNAPGGLKRPK